MPYRKTCLLASNFWPTTRWAASAKRRNKTDLVAYQLVFTEIQTDPNNELLVVEPDQRVSDTIQKIFIPSLTFQGGRRAQIEGVRIDHGLRGRGLGVSSFLIT